MLLETTAVQSEGNPLRQYLLNESKKESLLINQLYSLVPQDVNTLATVPLAMVFEPDRSYYIVKNLSVNRLDQNEYEKIKAMEDYKQSVIQSQSLAAVHFEPENILKRMNFRWSKEYDKTRVAEMPVKPDIDEDF